MKEQRELKFRAWNGEEMISPDYIDRNGRAFWKENSIPTYSDNVMQWTGLKDRHLNDIYEGDIIQYTQALFNTKDEKWPVKQKEVKWDKHTGSWNVFETIAGELNIEVIGNIHEPAQQQKQTL